MRLSSHILRAAGRGAHLAALTVADVDWSQGSAARLQLRFS